MANSKSKNKNHGKPKDTRSSSYRAAQVLLIIFSIILILSMVLSLTTNF